MPDSQETREEEQGSGDETREQGGDRGEEQSEAEAAQKAQEEHEEAQEEMKNLEEQDEPPTDLEDWPSGKAKYVTYGGSEGDHSYDEGPEAKLGPPDLERKADGSVLIEGEEVDDPDEHKADPVPGGPTDPDAPQLRGERKKREKMEEMYDDENSTPDAVRKADEQRGNGDGDSGDDESDGDGGEDSDEGERSG